MNGKAGKADKSGNRLFSGWVGSYRTGLGRVGLIAAEEVMGKGKPWAEIERSCRTEVGWFQLD